MTTEGQETLERREALLSQSIWDYDRWPSREPCDWKPSARGGHPDDQLDFHVDLGCGTIPKGRIGVDRYPHPTVDLVMNLDEMTLGKVDDGQVVEWLEIGGFPFPDSSIESIVTHHCFEHIGDGYIRLIDECWRVLKPDAPLRIIVPAFPSHSAVCDPDHKRWFLMNHFKSFEGAPDGSIWTESFSVPYTKARFRITAEDYTPFAPPQVQWTPDDARETRVTLRAVKADG